MLSFWKNSYSTIQRSRNIGIRLKISQAQSSNQAKPVIAIRREDNVVSSKAHSNEVVYLATISKIGTTTWKVMFEKPFQLSFRVKSFDFFG